MNYVFPSGAILQVILQPSEQFGRGMLMMSMDSNKEPTHTRATVLKQKYVNV